MSLRSVAFLVAYPKMDSISLESAEYAVAERELFVSITLTRSGDLSKRSAVTFATDNGTAVSAEDFVDSDGTAYFGSHVATVTVSVPILDDPLGEASEHFTFSIVSVDDTSTVAFPRTATITILDDEAPTTQPGPEPLVPSYQVSATPIISGIRNPISMRFVEGSTGALVADKSGRVFFVDLAAVDSKPKLVLDLRDRVNAHADRGLLGMAFHPKQANHPYLYVFYVVDPPETFDRGGGAGHDGSGNRFAYVSRFNVEHEGAIPSIALDSEVVLLGGAAKSLSDTSGGGAIDFTDEEHATEPASNINPDGTYKRDYIKVDSATHAGGALAFGPDGMLYVSTGDGSSFNYADPRTMGVQSLDSLNGKILRVDPLTGQGRADNPFATSDLDANRSKVWAMGLRNPYTMTFASDGRLFLSETGWNSWEEINLITKGANYGWPFYEGGDGGLLLPTEAYSDWPEAKAFYVEVDSGTRIVTPAYRAFSHVGGDPGFQISCIVGSSSIYAGDAYPAAFKNDYFFTDVVGGEIYSVDINDPNQAVYVTDIGQAGPTSFVEGPDGYMYLADLTNDRILRLEIADLPAQ